jgi:hypothetical protein
MTVTRLYTRVNGTDIFINGIYGQRNDAEFDNTIAGLNKMTDEQIPNWSATLATKTTAIMPFRVFMGDLTAVTTQSNSLADATRDFGVGTISNEIVGVTFPFGASTVYTAGAGGDTLINLKAEYLTGGGITNPDTVAVYSTSGGGSIYYCTIPKPGTVGHWYNWNVGSTPIVHAGDQYQILAASQPSGGHKHIVATLSRQSSGMVSPYKNIKTFVVPAGGATLTGLRVICHQAGGVTGTSHVAIFIPGIGQVFTVTLPNPGDVDAIHQSGEPLVTLAENDVFQVICDQAGGHKRVSAVVTGMVGLN